MQGVEWKLQNRDAEVISMHNSMTKMDILPDCLIGKILCFLSFKEATQMSILSKTWLRAWLTHPNLEFVVDRQKNITIVDAIMERYKDGKIPIEKFMLCGRFTSIDKWIEIALQNGVKDLVVRVGTISLPIFTILAAKPLRELVLGGYDSLPLSLSSCIGVANCFCFSLRKLSLCHQLYIDENMLQTLLNSCPLIVSFTFERCLGLEKIELLNLQKIKSVSITTRINCPLKIRAPTLEHLSYCRSSLDELDVIECRNLKSLDLAYVLTSDGFLEHLLSRFQFLEVLKIQWYDGIAEINSPNLVSFEYTGKKIPQLTISRESRKLKHSKFVLQCHDYLDDAWFCKLRKFLSKSISWSQVSLSFPECNINMNDLQRYYRFATPRVDAFVDVPQLHVFVDVPQVDVLNVDILWQNEKCPMFVDALLRSCHPRRLNLHSSIKMITCFIRCLLMYTKNPSLSSSQGSKPWHGQLIDIEAFDEENQPLQLRSGWELEISTLVGRRKFHFLLDWRCS